MSDMNVDSRPLHEDGYAPLGDETGEIQESINSFPNISAEGKKLLADYFSSYPDIAGHDKLELIKNLSTMRPQAVAAFFDYIKKNPEADFKNLVLLIDIFKQAGDASLDTLESKGSALLELMTKVEQQWPGSAAEFAKNIDSLGVTDPKQITAFMVASEQMVSVSTGGTVNPPALQELLQSYANSPAPMHALNEDFKRLQQLNSAYNGAGIFELKDLHAMGLSATTGQSEATISHVAQSLNGLIQSSSFSSSHAITNFIEKYIAAGGQDVTGMLKSLPEIEAGINQIKSAIGKNPDESLTQEYEVYVHNLLAKGAADGDLQGAIDGEIQKIGKAYKDQVPPLNELVSMAYQTDGFKQAESNYPLSLEEPQGENLEPVPRPGSAHNSGSTEEGIVFPSLSEKGYDDIADSPLFSENDLQDKFGGDVTKYAKYLAQAHTLMEHLGLRPPSYDGEGEDLISLERVKIYLSSRGYNGEAIANEMKYIDGLVAHFNDQADGAGLASSDGADVTTFDPVKYIRTDGEIYRQEAPEHLQRPQGRFPKFSIISTSTLNSIDASFSAHDAAVRTTVLQINLSESEKNSQNEIIGILTKYNDKNEPGAKIDPITPEDKAKLKQLYAERLSYANMENFIEENSKIEDKEGQAAYYNEDGSLKKVYDKNGNSIKNDKGQDLTLLELDAMKKFASEEMIKKMVPDAYTIKDFSIPDSLELPDHSDPTAKSALISDYERHRGGSPTKIDFDKIIEINDLQLKVLDAELSTITARGERLSTKLTEANSKLEVFKEFFQSVIKIFLNMFEDSFSGHQSLMRKF